MCNYEFHACTKIKQYTYFFHNFFPFSHLAPCQPQGAQVNLECSTNVASVSWENSGPDQVQVVTAVDSRGAATTCNSSSSNCTFRQLSCGESYAVSVVGHTDMCSSQPAVADMFDTGIYRATKKD